MCAACRTTTTPRTTESAHAREQQMYADECVTPAQPSIIVSAENRATLVDWLAEVAAHYAFAGDTLFVGVALLDRYLSSCSVAVYKEELQLVGCACLALAAKVEEVYPPLVEDYVFISDDSITRAQLNAMETHVLERLQWRVPTVTAYTFLHMFLHLAHSEKKVTKRQTALAHCLCEATLLDARIGGAFVPSCVASACVFRASGGTIVSGTGVDRLCVQAIVACYDRVRAASNAGKHSAITEKYKHKL